MTLIVAIYIVPGAETCYPQSLSLSYIDTMTCPYLIVSSKDYDRTICEDQTKLLLIFPSLRQQLRGRYASTAMWNGLPEDLFAFTVTL